MSNIKYRQLIGSKWHCWGFLPDSFNDKICFTGPVTNQMANPIHCQFTGLLDVSGVEIYEGDIVEILDTDHSSKDAIINWLDGKGDMPVKRVGVDVVVMDRFPVYWLKKEEFGYEGEELISPRKARIIGNIYQNKELLSCAD